MSKPSYCTHEELAAVVDAVQEALTLQTDLAQEIRNYSLSVIARAEDIPARVLNARGIDPKLISENSLSQGVSRDAVSYWMSWARQERLIEKIGALQRKLASTETKAA